MSIRYGQMCPVSKAAEILGERWTILIVRELIAGTKRFSDFQRSLSQISPTLLTRRLQQLEEVGLVFRQSIPDQRRVEYQPTAAAKELQPVILGLAEWGMKWARGQMSDDELDVELLMYDLNRRLDQSQLPGGRIVIKFHFPKLPKFAHWWIVLEDDGTRELCVDNPRKAIDVEIITDLRTLAEIWAGDLEIRHAKESGKLLVKGKEPLVRNIAAWLRPCLFAHVRPGDR